MKMLMRVSMPHEPFNTLVREGKADEVMEKILEEIKPIASYYTEMEGFRTQIHIINIKDSSEIPKFAEPFFLTFDADTSFHAVMDGEDLKNAGLDELGKKWGQMF